MTTTSKPATPRRRPAKKTPEASTETVAQESVVIAVEPTPVEAAPVTTEPAVVVTPEPESPASEPVKAKKPKKIKLVRDSFTIPQNEYAVLDELKARCLAEGVAVKKSELLRAGIITLSKLSDADLLETMALLEKIKTGRPAK